MENETDSVFAADQQNGKGELYRLMMSILKEGETDKQETAQQRPTPEVEKEKDDPAAQQTSVAQTVAEPQRVQQQTVQPQEQPKQQAERPNGDVEQPAGTVQPVQDVQADELDDDTKDLLAVKNHNIDDARKYVEKLGKDTQEIIASGVSDGTKREAKQRYESAAKVLNERIEAHNAEQKAENDRLRAEAERKQAQAKKEHDEKYADINYVSDWMDGHKVDEANNTMLASEGFKEGAAAASGKDIFGIAKAAKEYISENTGKLSTAAINDYVNGMLAANRLKEKYGGIYAHNYIIEPIDSLVLENKDIPDSVKKEFIKVRTPKEFGNDNNNYQSILKKAVDDFVRLFEKEYRSEQGNVEKKAMGDYDNIAKNPFADADDKDAARMVYASKVLTGVDLKPMIDRAFNSIPKDRMAALTLALSKDFGYDENKAAEYIANEFQRVCLSRTGAKVNSDTEAVIIGGLMNTLVGSLAQASMRSTGGGNKLTLLDAYSESIDERAKEWAKQGLAGYGKIALRSATTMAGDSPAFGGIGKIVGGGTKWSLVRLLPRLSKGVTPKAGDAAFKMLSMTNSGRVVIGVANGAGLGAVYSPVAYSLGSLARGVTPEFGEALKSSASGAVDFSMMGFTPSIMNYGADKVLKLFNGTGKAATAIRVATNIAFKDIFGPGANAALVTAKDVLLSSEKISEDLKSYYFEKFGEFLGMHVPGKLSNIRHIADEYKVRTQLNESVFTKEELRSLGYKSVKQMFDDIYAPSGKKSPGYFMKDGKAIASKLYGITVNPNVLESAKMKLLTAIGGGAIATPTITRSEIVSEYGEKGKEVYTVRTYTADGKAFSERDFGSLKDAKLEETRLGTVIKRNNVAIAEGARDAQWMDTCSERATRTVLSELNGTATEKELTDMLNTALEKDRNGEQLTDGEKRMLKRFDEVYLQNLRSENADNSSSVRRDFNNSRGVDIDKILAKDYYKWSESEREAVDDYIKALNGEKTEKDMPSEQTEQTATIETPAEPAVETPVVESEKGGQQEVAAPEKETEKPSEETTGKGDIGIEDYIKINKADEETANDIREDAENYTDEVNALRSESEQAVRYSNGESSEKPEHWDYWKEKFGLEEPKAKTEEEVKPVEEPKSASEPIVPADEKPTGQPKEPKAEEKPVEVETPKEEDKADTKAEVEQAAETKPVEETGQEQPAVEQPKGEETAYKKGEELVVEHDGNPVTIVVDAVGNDGNVTKSHVKSSGEPYHSNGKVVFAPMEKQQEPKVGAVSSDSKSAGKGGDKITNGNRVMEVSAMFDEKERLLKEYPKTSDEASADNTKRLKGLRIQIAHILTSMSDKELGELSEKYGKEMLVQDEVSLRNETEGLTREVEARLEKDGELHSNSYNPRKFSIHSYASTNKSLPTVLMGVYHSPDGYAVSSDGYVLIASKLDYDPAMKGEVVDKKGSKIVGRYPNWKSVVVNHPFKLKGGVQMLAAKMKAIQERFDAEYNRRKEAGEKITKKKLNDYYSVSLLLPNNRISFISVENARRFVDACLHLGCTDIEYSNYNRSIIARSKNGFAIVMPKIVNKGVVTYSDAISVVDLRGGKAQEQAVKDLVDVTESEARKRGYSVVNGQMVERQGGTGGTAEEGSNSLIGASSKVEERVRVNSRLKDLSERAKTAKTDEERAQVASERAEVVSEYVKGEKGRSVSVVPTQDALADAVESRDLKNEVRQHTESGELINGVYDKRTGKIHIVAENVETADDIDAVYIHESSHKYSREVDNNRAAGELVDNHTTEELEQALREVAGDDVADVYMACKPGNGDFAYRRMLADEILAYSCVKRNAGEKTGITNEKINNQTKQHYEKVSDYFGGRKRDGGKSDRGKTETGEGVSTEPSAGERGRGGSNDREEEGIDSGGLFSVSGRNANGGDAGYDSKHSEIEQAVNMELGKNSTSDEIKAEIDRVKKLRAEATKEYLSGKPHSEVAKGDAAALRERLNELNAKKTVAVENERSAKLTEKLADLNSKLIEATESGDTEKVKSLTTETKRLKTDIANTGIRARYKAKISEIKSKSENVSDLAKSLVKYISGELSPILAKEMGKAEFNALVGSVRDIAKQWNAKDRTEQDRNNLATKLDDTIRKVDDVIVGIETRKLINDLADMLSVKTTKKDSGGKKVGVKVSNTVRIAIETLKGVFRDFDGEFGNGLKSLVKSLDGMLEKKKSLQGRLKELELSEASANERLNSGAITKDEYDAEIGAINRERDNVKSEMADFDTVFSDALSETNDAIDAAVPRTTEEYNKLWNDLMAKQQDEQDGVAQMSAHDKEMLKIMPFVRSLVDVRELFAQADKSQSRLKALEEQWKSDAPTPTDTEMEAANRMDMRLQTALKIREEMARLYAAKDAARKALRDLNNDVMSLLKIGKTQYMAQQQERLEHRSEVAHIGIAAVDTGKERPAGVKGQQEAKESEEKSVGVLRRMWNWLFLAPTESAESMLSRVDVNHFSGEGELYHLIIESERGYSRSEDRRIESVEALRSEIQSKCKELFGSKNPKDGNKKIEFTQTLSDEQVPAEVTKGEALSLYLWSLSEEGRAKLESQGIDAFSISEIKAVIGDNWVKFGEWIVGDFLPKLYDKYNEKYVEKYGTEITRHENYFPFKIYGGDIVTKDELESFDNGNTIPMPSALKERVKHNYQLSTTEDALKILNEHVAEMEDWYHFADMREDISILLSSRAFRETLKLQGPNKWRKFRDAMHTLAGVDKRDESVTSQVINEVQSMYASSAVGFRYWTALKQWQSTIAGMNYSYDPRFQARLFANILMPVGTELLAGKVKNAENTFAGMVGSCYWAWKNMPQFRERYRNGKMGNIMLEYESVVGNRNRLYRWIKKNISQMGLFLNKVFDAAAVAVYSKSIYDYEFTRSIRNGATEEDAHRYAMTCAETNYNKTQQSSGRAYVSKMQVSGNPIEKGLTTFQTASLGFMRKSINHINDIQRAYRMLRLGKEKPLHSISKGAKATVDLLWDGVVMPASWNLINVIGVAGFYYGAKAIFNALFGGDDDNAPTKDATGKTALDRFIEGHAGDVAFATISAPLQGTILNNLVNSAWSGYGGWTPTMAEGAISEVLRSAGETLKGYKDSDSLSDYLEDLDEDAAKYTIKTVLYALFRGYTGIDMKTVERFYNAFYDYKVKGSSLNLISVANFLSTPMSNMRDHEAKDYYLGAYGKTGETAKDLEDYIVKRAYADGKIFKRDVESGGARGKVAELFRSRAFKRDLNKYVDEWAEYHIRDASDAADYHDEWLKNHERKEIIRKNRELEYSDEQAKQKTDSLKLALGYEQKSGNSERTLRYNLVHDILRQIKKKLTGGDKERKEAFALMRELERIDKVKGHTHSDYVKLAEKAGVKDFQMIPKGVSESGKYVNKSDIDNGTVARGDVKGSYGIIATEADVKADARFRKLQDGSENQKAKAKEVMKMYSDGDISYQDAYRRMTDIGDGLVTAVYAGEADRLIKDLKAKLTKAVKAGNNKAADAIMERIRSIRGKVIDGDMKPKEEVAKMLLNSID